MVYTYISVYYTKCYASCIVLVIVTRFKYLGTTLANQNSTHEEITNNSPSGNACYSSIQNHLFSRLISKNLRIRKLKSHSFFWCFAWKRNLFITVG